MKRILTRIAAVSTALVSTFAATTLPALGAPAQAAELQPHVVKMRTNPHYPTTRALAAPGAPIHVLEVSPKRFKDSTGKTLKVPGNYYAASCSQGPVGTVYRKGKKPRRVMFTAGHCLQNLEKDSAMRAATYAPTPSGEFLLGYRDRLGYDDLLADDEPLVNTLHDAVNTADWSAVKLRPEVKTTNVSFSRDEYGRAHGRPVKLKGVEDYSRLYPFQISADNFGKPICKDGSRTGRSCGYQVARTAHGVWSWGLDIEKGDSGGINYNPRTKKVIGVSSMGIGPLSRTQPVDRAIEDGYGIKSGQVNRHFKVSTESTPRARFKTGEQHRKEVETFLDAQGATEIEKKKAEQSYVEPKMQSTVQDIASTTQKVADSVPAAAKDDATELYESTTKLEQQVNTAHKQFHREVAKTQADVQSHANKELKKLGLPGLDF